MVVSSGIGKPPAVALPSWFGRVPSIQQQLEFHVFTKVLEESHDMREQAAFEQVHSSLLKNPDHHDCHFMVCGLKAHQEFKGTILYILTTVSQKLFNRQSLVYTIDSDNWHETHRFCSDCSLELKIGIQELLESFQTYAKSVKPFPQAEEKNIPQIKQVVNLPEKKIMPLENISYAKNISGFQKERKKQNFLEKPMVSKPSLNPIKLEQKTFPKGKLLLNQSIKRGKNITKDESQTGIENLAMLKSEPEDIFPKKLQTLPESKNVSKKRFSINLLQFRLAEKKYNHLIWIGIKRKMMFFRQENKHQLQNGIKAKIQLSIDETGKVIWKKLTNPSISRVFNRRILDSVNLLRLPPPMEILVQNPPYVVTIVIEP